VLSCFQGSTRCSNPEFGVGFLAEQSSVTVVHCSSLRLRIGILDIWSTLATLFGRRQKKQLILETEL